MTRTVTARTLPIAIAFIVSSAAATVSAAERYTYADLVGRLTDLQRLATPVVPGEKTSASTSHDRGMSYDPRTDTYRNWAANGDGGGGIRREGNAQVMVDLKGPGVLWRIWSALAGGGHIKIFIDGNETPVVDKPFHAWFDGLHKEYPNLAMTLSRGRNEFVPISFSKSCKVTLGPGWGQYFHCTHTLFPKGTEVEPFPGFTKEVVARLKKASDAWGRRGANPYPSDAGAAGKKKTLTIQPGKSESVSLAGAGAIRALKVTPLELPGDRIAQEDILRELTISMFWDGGASPGVWAPLGDFFATSPGINPFKTLAMGSIDGTFYSYWYMPYADGAQIVFTNDGKAPRKLAIELETVALEKATAARLLRFSAAWHSDDFTGLDPKRFRRRGGDRWPDWPLLIVEGKGRYVGMTEHIWKFGGWWGEGDEKFFIDGEKYPSTVGTGSEDYIGYAWAAGPPFITFDSALAAVSRLRPDAQEDTSVCRFHVCDDLPFSKSFQGFIEVMPNGDCRPCVYDTCVYWYAERGVKNPYPAVPLARRRHPRPPRDRRDVVPSTMR
ncbi:MAG: glycoside hydrolase family 172 protein [Planctomycetota bacterium]